jgi:hypothetical protein
MSTSAKAVEQKFGFSSSCAARFRPTEFDYRRAAPPPEQRLASASLGARPSGSGTAAVNQSSLIFIETVTIGFVKRCTSHRSLRCRVGSTPQPPYIMKIPSTSRLGFLAAITLLAIPVAARADTTLINAVPFTITVAGNYALAGNLGYTNATGNAITIAVGNVTLDFNGYRLFTTAGNGSSATAVFAKNRANLAIRNGKIVGFYRGIALDADSGPQNESSNNVIENMRLLSHKYVGIYVNNSVSTRIENCQITETGGTTLETYSYGILGQGYNLLIRNNQITIVTAPVKSIGIATNPGIALILGNFINNTKVAMTLGAGSYYGNNILTYSQTARVEGDGQDIGGNF